MCDEHTVSHKVLSRAIPKTLNQFKVIATDDWELLQQIHGHQCSYDVEVLGMWGFEGISRHLGQLQVRIQPFQSVANVLGPFCWCKNSFGPLQPDKSLSCKTFGAAFIGLRITKDALKAVKILKFLALIFKPSVINSPGADQPDKILQNPMVGPKHHLLKLAIPAAQ